MNKKLSIAVFVTLILSTSVFAQFPPSRAYVGNSYRSTSLRIPKIFAVSFEEDKVVICLKQENCEDEKTIHIRSWWDNTVIPLKNGYSVTAKREYTEDLVKVSLVVIDDKTQDIKVWVDSAIWKR